MGKGARQGRRKDSKTGSAAKPYRTRCRISERAWRDVSGSQGSHARRSPSAARHRAAYRLHVYALLRDPAKRAGRFLHSAAEPLAEDQDRVAGVLPRSHSPDAIDGALQRAAVRVAHGATVLGGETSARESA